MDANIAARLKEFGNEVWDLTPGERIKLARKVRGWTQRQLSDKSGISEVSIRSYELGDYDPALFRLTCLGDALGVSLDWIAGRCEYCKDMS